MAPSAPFDEWDRLAALKGYDVLDTQRAEAFDALARLAAHVCGTPFALIDFVDVDRVWVSLMELRWKSGRCLSAGRINSDASGATQPSSKTDDLAEVWSDSPRGHRRIGLPWGNMPLERGFGGRLGYGPPAAATASSGRIFRLVMTSSTAPYSTACSAVRMK